MRASAPARRRVSPPVSIPCQEGESAPPDQSYTVQQAAKLTGLSEHTLRYYERAGLLRPVRRQERNRHRRYSAEDLARLSTLACLRAAGMPLDQMRRYFELMEQGAAAAPLQRQMLSEQRRVLEERMTSLRQHLEYLDRKVAYWQAVETGDHAQAAAIAERFFHSLRQS